NNKGMTQVTPNNVDMEKLVARLIGEVDELKAMVRENAPKQVSSQENVERPIDRPRPNGRIQKITYCSLVSRAPQTHIFGVTHATHYKRFSLKKGTTAHICFSI